MLEALVYVACRVADQAENRLAVGSAHERPDKCVLHCSPMERCQLKLVRPRPHHSPFSIMPGWTQLVGDRACMSFHRRMGRMPAQAKQARVVKSGIRLKAQGYSTALLLTGG